MSAPTVATLASYDLGRHRCSYDERDAILFALAVGAEASELRWVYENRLEVMPTFALTLGLWAVRAAGATGAYDPVRTLHVGQDLRVHGPLPRFGELDLEGRIAAVWDKQSAALVEVLVSGELFDATYTIYVPGAGGFGGERGPSSKRDAPGAPDWEVEAKTYANQAALYRLTGDRHPVHIDDEVARANGLKAPIMHGLCTLALVTKVVAQSARADLAALRHLSARLTAPVYPGDRLVIRGFDRGRDAVAFSASAGESVVLDAGEAEFEKSSS
jgi:MaoC dehydratase-like protein/2-enoyl-CoA hydratase-like protein